MKNNFRILSMLAFAVFLPFVMVFGQTPKIINFQGKLNDKDGKALTGNFSIVFSIYNTALAGEAQWQEPRSQVPVQSGIINILLGSVVPFPEALFAGSGQLYLGIKVADDPELTPRFQITSVPYAMQANLPAGIIVMWSGAIDNIPAGWALCDGKSYSRADGNGNISTPDLRERFVLGAGSGSNISDKGGASKVLIQDINLPTTVLMHTHSYKDVYYAESPDLADQINLTTTISIPNKRGSGDTDDNNVGWYQTRTTNQMPTKTGGKEIEILPPYFVLAYIMKL